MAFFTDAKHDEFQSRVLRITPANPRQWGTMNVSQMLHHLNLACGSALGFYHLSDESYFSSRTLFRWVLIDWFPAQPVGLRLPKGHKIHHDAEFDFDLEKQQLLKIVDAAWHARSTDDWGPHPMFGKMTLSEWGKLLQIHIDYHLKQFAAWCRYRSSNGGCMNETYKAIELAGLGNSRKQESHSVQYARHMGFEVVAIARGTNTPELAKKLGAHHYIDSAATDPAEGLQALGGAQVILITASGGKTTAATFKGLGNHIAIDSGRRPVV